MRTGASVYALVFASLMQSSASAQDRDASIGWYGIVADNGTWIGHGSNEVRAIGGGKETVDQQELLLDNGDYPDIRILDRTITRSDANGVVTAIENIRKTGRNSVRVTATIAVGEARITRRASDDVRSARVELPSDTRFDNGAGLLRGWDPAVQARLIFHSLDLDAMRVDRVTIAPSSAAPPSGATRLALRTRDADGALVGIQLIALDAAGAVISVSQPMFGVGVRVGSVPRAEALAPRPAYPVLRNAMIKSPYRVPMAALQARIRFAFGFRDGISFVPPETSDQRVATNADGVVIDICADCGPGLPNDPAFLDRARRPTAMIQSDDRRVLALAAPVSAMRISQAAKMAMLAKLGLPILERIDFNGHYSAVEAIERRAGDCTEAAVLLAALGRAAGIPTKIVNGLVYSRERYHGVSNVFMPHSWVLAHVDGKWRSFDMALETFDSTHLALSIGDGDARSMLAANQLAGLLVWKSMAEVRTSQPAP